MALTTETYVLKSGGRPSGDPSKYDFGEIQSLLNATNPGKVSAAGAAYNKAAQAMAKVAHELYLVGTSLSAKWEGADAAAAQKALGQLYTTANELYWRSQQAGQALQGYGAVLPQYKGLNWPPGGASPVEDTARQQVAEKVMKAVNQHIGNAWDAMPDKVQTNLPGLRPSIGEQPYPPGSNSGATDSGPTTSGSPGRGSAPVGHPRLPHAPHGGAASKPGDLTDGHGTELAGAPQASGGPTAVSPNPGSIPSPVAGSSPSSAVGGFSPGGMPSSLPGGRFGPAPLSGERPAPPGVLGEEPLPSARPLPGPPGNPATTEQAGAAQPRTGVMRPGAAAAGANDSAERQRSTWLSEDRKIWTAGDEPAPGVLGAGPVAGSTDEKGGERERTVWLDEDDEVWTGGATALHGTIGAAHSRTDAGDGAQEDEPDILDVEQLQKLLDSLDQDPQPPRLDPKTHGLDAGFLGDFTKTDEIGRLLNG